MDVKDCETYSDIFEYCRNNRIWIDINHDTIYARSYNPNPKEANAKIVKDSGVIIKIYQTDDTIKEGCIQFVERLDSDSELSVEKLKEMITNLGHYQIFKKYRKN